MRRERRSLADGRAICEIHTAESVDALLLDVGIFIVHVVNYIFHCHSFAPVVIADVLARLDWPADEEAPAGSWQCGVAGVT